MMSVVVDVSIIWTWSVHRMTTTTMTRRMRCSVELTLKWGYSQEPWHLMVLTVNTRHWRPAKHRARLNVASSRLNRTSQSDDTDSSLLNWTICLTDWLLSTFTFQRVRYNTVHTRHTHNMTKQIHHHHHISWSWLSISGSVDLSRAVEPGLSMSWAVISADPLVLPSDCWVCLLWEEWHFNTSLIHGVANVARCLWLGWKKEDSG